MKCDKCNKQASYHLTQIHFGKQVEAHLCESCAVEAGMPTKAQIPLNDILTDFVIAHTGNVEAGRPPRSGPGKNA